MPFDPPVTWNTSSLLCPTQFCGADRWVTRSTDGSSCLSPLLPNFKAALVLSRNRLTTDESPLRGFTSCANHAVADRRKTRARDRNSGAKSSSGTELEESSRCWEILRGNAARTHAHDIRMVPGGDRKDVFVSYRQDRELPCRGWSVAPGSNAMRIGSTRTQTTLVACQARCQWL